MHSIVATPEQSAALAAFNAAAEKAAPQQARADLARVTFIASCCRGTGAEFGTRGSGREASYMLQHADMSERSVQRRASYMLREVSRTAKLYKVNIALP